MRQLTASEASNSQREDFEVWFKPKKNSDAEAGNINASHHQASSAPMGSLAGSIEKQAGSNHGK